MSIITFRVFSPFTNEKVTLIGTKSGLHGVPYCTASNTLGIVVYSSISERTVRGTVPNRTVSERIGTITDVSENGGI
jgi:hypothetical protein